MKNKKLVIATVVVIGVLALLIFSGMQGNTGRNLTIQEAIADSQLNTGKYIQMEAKVVSASVKWDSKKPELVFEITDGKQNINVTFNDPGEEKHAEDLEYPPDNHHLCADPIWDLPGTQWCIDFSARFRTVGLGQILPSPKEIK